MAIWKLFETEIVKQKYMHSILQQSNFNTIKIKFKFGILEAPLMDENMNTRIWIS